MGCGDRLVSVGAHFPARLRYSTVARMINHAETPGETMRTVHIRAVTTTDASANAAFNVAVQLLAADAPYGFGAR